jgi:hypothetical protein
VLSEIDATHLGEGRALLPLLAGFNVGVEVAQLTLVLLLVPLIYPVRGRRWYTHGALPFGSCALGTAGLVWLVQRL